MEVLVALVLLSLFAVLAYRALDAVLEAQQRAGGEIQRWRALAMAFGRLEADLSAAVHHFDPQDPARGALRVQVFPEGGLQFDLLRLLREDANPAVVRVGYRCRDRGLSRLIWPDANNPGMPPRETTLLEDLDACTIRFMDNSGQWLDIWPAQVMNPLPLAVELFLIRADGIPLRRVWRVR